MKKAQFFFFLAMVFPALLHASLAEAYSGGNGSSGNPYRIADLTDLQELQTTPAHWNLSFLQTADIDASDTSTWDGGAGWSPIGNSFPPFTGVYDGAGYVVSGLSINRPGSDDQGLFGRIGAPAVIRNVHLTSVNVTGLRYVGALVGDSNGGTINHCSVIGNTAAIEHGVGGLVGAIVGSSVYDCSADCVVSSVEGSTGGLLGRSLSGSSLMNCHASGEVNVSGGYAGGLVGFNSFSTIMNCYATCNVSSSGLFFIGGLAGGVVTNSTVSNCYAAGNSMSTNGTAGGLLGLTITSNISNCYAFGHAAGVSSGALIGHNEGSLSDSFWNIDISSTGIGSGSNIGATGKTTAELQALSTFNDTATQGLDTAWPIVDGWTAFSSPDRIWGICSGVNNGYPFLLWQFDSDPCPGPQPIPTLSEWGMIILSLVLTGLTLWRMRRQNMV